MATGRLPEASGKHGGNVQAGYGFPAHQNEIVGTFGLSDKIDINVTGAGSFPARFGFGGGGITWYPVNPKHWRLGLTTGFGFGCGGEFNNERDCNHHVGGGSYVGFDWGYRFSKVFSFYQSNRYEFTKVQQIPITHWGLHTLGLQFDIGPHVFISLEDGFAYYSNSDQGFILPTGYLSLGFKWGKK